MHLPPHAATAPCARSACSGWCPPGTPRTWRAGKSTLGMGRPGRKMSAYAESWNPFESTMGSITALNPASVYEGGRFMLYAMRYRKPSRALTSAARKENKPSAARASLRPGIGSVASAHANALTQTESVSTRNTHVRASIRGGAAEDADIERCVSTASRTPSSQGVRKDSRRKQKRRFEKSAHTSFLNTPPARAMTPASALRDVDAIVVGGIARGPDSTGCDAHVARLVRGLEQSGLAVGRVDGSDGAAREALAEALMRAVRLGEDESRPAGRAGGFRVARASRRRPGRKRRGGHVESRGRAARREAEVARAALRRARRRRARERPRRRARRRAAGVVPQAVDLGADSETPRVALQRRRRVGGGVLRQVQRVVGERRAARRVSLAAAAELESVSNAERVYFADDSEGCRAGAAISLGAYGGGYVGCFADLNMEPATVSALVALARAAPGAGTARAAARLRRSPMRAAFASGAFPSGLDADRRERFANSRDSNAPSSSRSRRTRSSQRSSRGRFSRSWRASSCVRPCDGEARAPRVFFSRS